MPRLKHGWKRRTGNLLLFQMRKWDNIYTEEEASGSIATEPTGSEKKENEASD